MKILFLASDFPSTQQPTKGPFNRALAHALATHHEIRVINPIPWPTRLKRNAPTDRTNEEYPVQRPTYFYPPKFVRHRYHHWMAWSIRAAIDKATQDWKPDVLLSYWAHPDGAAGASIAKSIGIPSAVIVGGSDVLLLPGDSARRQAVVNALQNVDAVITVNQHLKTAVEKLGIHSEKIHLWSQGVNRNLFRPGDKTAARTKLGIDTNDFAFLCVARLVPVKGIDVLLQACRIVADCNARFQLYLVGDGPLSESLKSQAAQLQISSVVHFVGPRNADSLADWYRAADQTILPSRSEGLPNVLRESLACGTRFIASNVGGISEIAGPSDVLVPAQNPEALAGAMHNAISAGPRPAEPVDLPDWQTSADAIVRILNSLQTNPKPLAASDRLQSTSPTLKSA